MSGRQDNAKIMLRIHLVGPETYRDARYSIVYQKLAHSAGWIGNRINEDIKMG